MWSSGPSRVRAREPQAIQAAGPRLGLLVRQLRRAGGDGSRDWMEPTFHYLPLAVQPEPRPPPSQKEWAPLPGLSSQGTRNLLSTEPTGKTARNPQALERVAPTHVGQGDFLTPGQEQEQEPASPDGVGPGPGASGAKPSPRIWRPWSQGAQGGARAPPPPPACPGHLPEWGSRAPPRGRRRRHCSWDGA